MAEGKGRDSREGVEKEGTLAHVGAVDLVEGQVEGADSEGIGEMGQTAHKQAKGARRAKALRRRHGEMHDSDRGKRRPGQLAGLTGMLRSAFQRRRDTKKEG